MLRDEIRHVGSRETKRDMVSSARTLPSDSEVTRSTSWKTRTLYRYVILRKGLRGLNFQRRLHAASQRLDPNSDCHTSRFWYDSTKTAMENFKVAYNNSWRRLLYIKSLITFSFFFPNGTIYYGNYKLSFYVLIKSFSLSLSYLDKIAPVVCL